MDSAISHHNLRVLAVSSGGGHWEQMMRLKPVFEGVAVCYATVNNSYREDVSDHPFFLIPDGTRWSLHKFLPMALRALWMLIRVRPDAVVTTGSMPGFITLTVAKLFGCKTVWIDSIANAEELSMSGRLAGKVADVWLTQWQHLAQPKGPEFSGSVL